MAPHADDETLGAGGSLAKHVAAGDDVTVAVMTGHGPEPHPLWGREIWDVVRAEAREAMKVLGVEDLRFFELPAARVPEVPPHEVNALTTGLVDECRPNTVYIPFGYDLHGDHRTIAQSMMVACRPVSPAGKGVRSILAYETQSETHWQPAVEPPFAPTTFVDISEHLATKIEALSRYESQMGPSPHARSIVAVENLARWRGSLVGVAAAEAFVSIRTIV